VIHFDVRLALTGASLHCSASHLTEDLRPPHPSRKAKRIMQSIRFIALVSALLTFGAPVQAQVQEKASAAGPSELVRQGVVEYRKFSPAGAQRAKALAEEAIQLDGAHAPAWTLLAESQIATNPTGARSAAEKAVALDSRSPSAWTAFARAQAVTRDPRGAEKSFLRAIELDSNHAEALGYYSNVLAALGRYEESLQFADRAHALSPAWLDARYPPLIGLRRYDDVIAWARAGLAIDSTGPVNLNHHYLGYALLERGQYEDALRATARQRVLRESPPWTDAWTYARAGKTAEARRILSELVGLPSPTPQQQVAVAALYANLGETDNAFVWLERAYARGGPTNIGWHPQWAPIRSDPRFRAVVRSLGLEP
jgi:tetratricopeptide (TPR) repeat protein